MTDELKGLLIGGALVAGYVWWTRRRPDGRRSSSLDGTMPTSTLAAAWRGRDTQSAGWMARQSLVAPPGGGCSRLRVRGYGG